MDTKEQIAALRARIKEAAARAHEASMDEHTAESDLAWLEGREWDSGYHAAYVAAQTHAPGGEEWFWSLVNDRDARLVLAGEKVLTDFAPYQRPGIEAAMERLRAADSGTHAE
jgi:hypothetical protein